MSLAVDDAGRRARSRSPGRRERERSRSPGPALIADASPFPQEGSSARGGGGFSSYDYEDSPSSYAPNGRQPRSSADDLASPTYRRSKDRFAEEEDMRYSSTKYSEGPRSSIREKETRFEKERYSDRDSDRDREKAPEKDKFAYLPQKYAPKIAPKPTPKVAKVASESYDRYSRESDGERSSDRDRDRGGYKDQGRDRDRRGYYDRERDDDRERERPRRDKYEDDLAYGRSPPSPTPKYSRPEPQLPQYNYAKPKQWEYEQTEEKVTYGRTDGKQSDTLTLDAKYASNTPSPRAPIPGPSADKKSYRNSYAGDPRAASASVLTVEPGQNGRRSKRDSSPQPPTGRLSSLSVATPHRGSNLSLNSAPPSPLLESYHGTYQSMSPMPSPLLLPSKNTGQEPQIADISPIGSDEERSPATDKKRARRARFHDPVDDAARLARALKGEKRAPETEPLIEILPGLTHDQVVELRVEYKRLVKTGPDRKGVNVAKHIRARLKDEDPSLMKACYATALGQWESEAYWANFWYQGDKTRRELLIESLMGRTNDEIHQIKESFSDKKYDNSLSKCMRTELKEDKFKKAVLHVLDEQRMEEFDRHGRPLPIDRMLVDGDVKELHRAVRSEKGGESAMISIVVQRSDSHLREVLQTYNVVYKSNFARDALKKSGNLVGELLAHILNGVINKPVRDALLIHHALTASKRDELRRELLISRLVRFHWDRHHMAAVKAAYRERYGRDMQEAVKEGTSGEWGLFCRELCIRRMPDDVRRVERVEIIR